MRTKMNIFNPTTIIYNKNLKNSRHIYTAKHINNTNNNSLIKNKKRNNTSKAKKK